MQHDKVIEIDELEDGDRVEFDPHITVVKGFTDLVTKLDYIIQGHEERVRADLARNQTQLEILGTLQALIKKQVEARGPDAPQLDVQPIVQALADIRSPGASSYRFEIERDNRGFMQRITAVPAETRH